MIMNIFFDMDMDISTDTDRDRDGNRDMDRDTERDTERDMETARDGNRERDGERDRYRDRDTYCEVHFFGHYCILTSKNTGGAILELNNYSERVCKHKLAAPNQESKQ
jgi:hypothetical protein